jgi:Protein of unknown function (DUF3073)
MGRGRAKAKQTKVARQLKYGVPQTDLERLEAELQGRSADEGEPNGEDETAVDDDPYSEYVDEDEDDAEDED